MTVKELAEKLGLKLLAGSGGTDREVLTCYIGDLLSWVMGRAREGSAWLTVMGNLNAVAVAALADCACIILTENAPLDDDAKEKAELQNIPVYITEDNAYNTGVKIYKLLK